MAKNNNINPNTGQPYTFMEQLEQTAKRAQRAGQVQFARDEAKRFAKSLGLSPEEQRDLFHSILKNRKNAMRGVKNQAFKDITAGQSDADIQKVFGLDPSGNRKAGAKAYINRDALHIATPQERKDIWKAAMAEIDKENGKNLTAFSITSGYVAEKDHLAKASFKERLKYYGKTVADSTFMTAGGRDILANNTGFMTGGLKKQLIAGSNFNRAMVGFGNTAGGMVGLALSFGTEDPLAEYIMGTASSAMGQAAWRRGKALASVFMPEKLALSKAGHIPRVMMGLTGATIFGLGSYVAMATGKSLTSNESEVVKMVKKATSREVFTNVQDTQATATMRQRALQKLSASSLNNRGQLLGNEAQILRGSAY